MRLLDGRIVGEADPYRTPSWFGLERLGYRNLIDCEVVDRAFILGVENNPSIVGKCCTFGIDATVPACASSAGFPSGASRSDASSGLLALPASARTPSAHACADRYPPLENPPSRAQL